MKILITAGGTGGHFYPGLAVAKEFLKQSHKIHFIIKRNDMVAPLLEREGIDYCSITSSGFKRSLSPANFITLVKLFIGTLQSFFILLRVKPDRVLVMGGYLSFAPALAARFLGIPTGFHEQNVKPGLANRVLNKFVSHVALSFKESESFFKGDKVLTGNPVRESLSRLPSKDKALSEWGLKTDLITLLIFGGSQGARRINELVTAMATNGFPGLDRIQFLHFTGNQDEAWVQSTYQKLSSPFAVQSYCHNMESAYAASDLILCRSGASTISELLMVKKPAILIPYPYATGGHQTFNAKVLFDIGAAKLEEEKNLTEKRLADIIGSLVNTPGSLQEMREAYEQAPIDVSQSASQVCRFVEKLT